MALYYGNRKKLVRNGASSVASLSAPKPFSVLPDAVGSGIVTKFSARGRTATV